MTDKDYENYLIEYSNNSFHMTEDVRQDYICKIKDAAREIFYNAEEYVGLSIGFSDLEITIKLHTATDTISLDSNCPIITSKKVNVVPPELNKPKDLSDPYYEPKKNCDNCYFSKYPDISCPSKCWDYSEWKPLKS